MQGYIRSTFFTHAGPRCLQGSIGLLCRVTFLHVALFFQLETGLCIRVHMEHRILLRRAFVVSTCSYPISVVFSDVDVAFAMSRCVLPYRVPARRLVCLAFQFAPLCCPNVTDAVYGTLCLVWLLLSIYCTA